MVILEGGTGSNHEHILPMKTVEHVEEPKNKTGERAIVQDNVTDAELDHSLVCTG